METIQRIAIGALLPCAASLAQDSGQSHWQPHLNAAYSLTQGVASDYLENGILIGGGVTWRNPQSPLALRLDLHYTQYQATDRLISLGTAATRLRIDDGRGLIAGVDVNAVYQVPIGPRWSAYATAGVGGYYRRIELTQTALFGGVFCDDWWGVCYSGIIPGQRSVAEASTRRLGWNAGVGLEYTMDRGILFLDARYQRIQTSEPTEFIPIRVGYRF